MAEPKKKRSKTRARRARAGQRQALPQLIQCSGCAAQIQPHMVCPHCGHYKKAAQSTSTKTNNRKRKAT